MVLGEVRYTSRVTFSKDAYFILADGAKIEIETEGTSEHGIDVSGNLAIYEQSAQSGILDVSANGLFGHCIYSFNDVTISGGSVTATGTNKGFRAKI